MKQTAVDRYITGFDGEVKRRLLFMQGLVKTEVPQASETISYGLIGYKVDSKPLLYFGAFSTHIGLYATPNGHAAFKDAFSVYKQGKGSVQFPLDQPLPVDLIRKVIIYRREQSTKQEGV